MKRVFTIVLALVLMCSLTSQAMAKSKKSKPREVDPKAAKYTIALDAGHAFNVAGKYSCIFEKDVTHTFRGKTITVKQGERFKEHIANVGIASELEKILKKCGFKVVRSGWNDDNALDDTYDYSTKIPEEFPRRDLIRESKADITISIHYNAMGDGSKWHPSNGIMAFYWEGHEQSKLLASHVMAQLGAQSGQKNHGVLSNRFWMTDNTKMGTKAACLIEHAFMTNQDEAYTLFCDPEAWFNYATATARGICTYLDIKYVGPKPTKQAAEPVVPEGHADF